MKYRSKPIWDATFINTAIALNCPVTSHQYHSIVNNYLCIRNEVYVY